LVFFWKRSPLRLHTPAFIVGVGGILLVYLTYHNREFCLFIRLVVGMLLDCLAYHCLLVDCLLNPCWTCWGVTLRHWTGIVGRMLLGGELVLRVHWNMRAHWVVLVDLGVGEGVLVVGYLPKGIHDRLLELSGVEQRVVTVHHFLLHEHLVDSLQLHTLQLIFLKLRLQLCNDLPFILLLLPLALWLTLARSSASCTLVHYDLVVLWALNWGADEVLFVFVFGFGLTRLLYRVDLIGGLRGLAFLNDDGVCEIDFDLIRLFPLVDKLRFGLQWPFWWCFSSQFEEIVLWGIYFIFLFFKADVTEKPLILDNDTHLALHRGVGVEVE
jgi:hypothetical protein